MPCPVIPCGTPFGSQTPVPKPSETRMCCEQAPNPAANCSSDQTTVHTISCNSGARSLRVSESACAISSSQSSSWTCPLALAVLQLEARICSLSSGRHEQMQLTAFTRRRLSTNSLCTHYTSELHLLPSGTASKLPRMFHEDKRIHRRNSSKSYASLHKQGS